MNRIVVSAAAGLAGGALGLFAMRYAMQGSQKVMDKALDDEDEPHEEEGALARHEGEEEDEYISLTGFRAREGESATAALARGVYERATGRELDSKHEEAASEWVHRGYGEAMGVAYALAALGRGWGVMGGVAFGALLWLFGDEIAVPLLGLSKKPTSYGADVHVSALVGHLAYGAGLGAAIKAADAWLEERTDDEGYASAGA